MPSPPEFLDGPAEIGIAEVLQKVEAEHPAQADGHVTVPGEIEVDLQGVAEGAQPGQADVQLLGLGGKHQVRHAAHRVGDEQLFGKPQNKPADALGSERGADLPLVDLLGHVVVLDNGPCNKLGEKGNVQRQLDKAPGRLAPVPVDVDHVGETLEGEKGNAHRQGNARQWDLQRKGPVHRGEKEIGVLEQGKQAQIYHHRGGHHPSVPSLGGNRQQPSRGVVDQGGKQHQQHVDRLPESVEQETGREQQKILALCAGDDPR